MAVNAMGAAGAGMPSSGASAARVASLGSSSASRTRRIMSDIASITGTNTAASAQEAAKLRDWQTAQNLKAMEFSARQAALNRDWQKMMSDTAHQREVRDLMAAGLNPVLSAMGGNGASTPSGATASGVTSSGAMGNVDMSAAEAFVSILGALLSSMTSLRNTATSAVTSRYATDKAAETSRFVSGLSTQAQVQAAGIAAAAQRYGHDISSMTSKDIAGFNAIVNNYMAERGYEHDFDIREAFPSNIYQAAGSVVNATGGVDKAVSDINSFLADPLTSILGLFNIHPNPSKYQGGGRR